MGFHITLSKHKLTNGFRTQTNGHRTAISITKTSLGGSLRNSAYNISSRCERRDELSERATMVKRKMVTLHG